MGVLRRTLTSKRAEKWITTTSEKLTTSGVLMSGIFEVFPLIKKPIPLGLCIDAVESYSWVNDHNYSQTIIIKYSSNIVLIMG